MSQEIRKVIVTHHLPECKAASEYQLGRLRTCWDIVEQVHYISKKGGREAWAKFICKDKDCPAILLVNLDDVLVDVGQAGS